MGGCSIGDTAAGFDVSWLVEKDPLAAASLRDSHPHAKIYQEDVQLFLAKCNSRVPGYPTPDDVDHLQSSPPCQGFSLANRGGQNDDCNNTLSHETVKAAKYLKPRTGMIENIRGILQPKHLNHIIKIIYDLINLGYQVRIALHDAKSYGVPQNRKRVIITFAAKDTELPETPKTTHEGNPVTLREAIDDLLPIACDMNEGSGLVQLKSGEFTFNHVASTPASNNIILDYDEPVNTITTVNANALTQPKEQHRTLLTRELARLFSYPNNKKFYGSLRAIRKQIGNSVPVAMAEAISSEIVAVHKNNT